MNELTCNAATFALPGTQRSSDHPGEGPRGARVDAVDVSRRVGGRQIIRKLSLSVESGELVAIAGGSGAGKTTLLQILAGLRPPSAGEVRHDGLVRRARVNADFVVGYVPQDDIIHLEMPLRRTLRYAALLRLPAGTPTVEAERIVEETMQDLDLADRGGRAGARAVRRSAQASQHRRGATDPTTPFLPRRTHVRARSRDCG